MRSNLCPGKLDLVTGLIFWSKTPSLSWFFQQVVASLSSHLQEEWIAQNPEFQPANETDAWLARGSRQAHKKRALSALQIARDRKRQKFEKDEKATKKPAPKAQPLPPLHAARDLYQYYMASRREFQGCPLFCLVSDESRKGGKDRLATVLLNLQTGKACFGPPQDSKHRFALALSPSLRFVIFLFLCCTSHFRPFVHCLCPLSCFPSPPHSPAPSLPFQRIGLKVWVYV